MRLVFTPEGWDSYVYWQTTDRKILKRINSLLQATVRDPFEGIGKPEPLKYGLPNTWSRRITDEHRLVYLLQDDDLVVLSVRYHYEK